MDVVPFFKTQAEASVLVKPSNRTFNDPPRRAESAAVFGVAFGDDGFNAFGAQCVAMRLGIVPAVALKAVGAATRSSAFAADRGNRLHQRKQLGHVMSVGGRQGEAQRDALRVGKKMVFAPRLPSISWIRPRLLPPKTARTDALSTTARDQSMASASLSRASSSSCTCCHMPACCQACRRRQQVMPLPQPISCGRYSHGIPVRNTKRIPVRACRFGIAGRPLLLGGLSGGSRGSMNSQRLSGRIGRAMPLLLRSPRGFD
jgi:hypothetical protein